MTEGQSTHTSHVQREAGVGRSSLATVHEVGREASREDGSEHLDTNGHPAVQVVEETCHTDVLLGRVVQLCPQLLLRTVSTDGCWNASQFTGQHRKVDGRRRLTQTSDGSTEVAQNFDAELGLHVDLPAPRAEDQDDETGDSEDGGERDHGQELRKHSDG